MNTTVSITSVLKHPVTQQVSVMVASSGSSSSGGGCGSSSMHEPLVYLNGCLKNVTNDASNQRGLVKLGALQVLASLLTQLAAQVREERGGGGAQCSAAGTVKVWSEFPYLLPGRSRGRELVHSPTPHTSTHSPVSHASRWMPRVQHQGGGSNKGPGARTPSPPLPPRTAWPPRLRYK